jgi:hypothetical protein
MVNGDGEYHDMWTAHPMWIHAAVKAAKQGHAKELYRPPGYEKCGYTVNFVARNDGFIRWALSYRFGHGKNTTVATWLTDWLPLDRAQKAEKPVTPPTEPIHITSGGCDYYAYVFLDSAGLPYTAPTGR